MDVMPVDIKILQSILDSREARAEKQKEILKKYPHTLISFTLNTPGAKKSSDLYSKVHKVGMKAILKSLRDNNKKVYFAQSYDYPTGPEGFISVDMDPIEAKKMVVELENNHELGRIFDMDVFDKNHNQISRSMLNLAPRKCLICEKAARYCIRTRAHTYEELIKKVEEMSLNYFSNKEKP